MAQVKTVKIKVDSKDAVKGIDQVEKGVKGIDSSAKGAKTGLGGMTGAAKGLGVAFKALGIGLIISAFMKLKDIFSGNIETARMFERVASRLSAAFDVIRDRTENFIKALIDLKNPLKAFKEAFTGTTKEIKEETAAMAALTKTLQDVRDEERAMTTVRAMANKVIAESRLLAEDETKALEVRLVALRKAITEEQRVADIEVATQEKKVTALQAIVDLGTSSETTLQELADERAKLIDLQTSSIQRQLRVTRELNTMERELAADNKKLVEQEKIVAVEKIDNDKLIRDSAIKTGIIRRKAAKDTSEFEVKTEKLAAEQKLAIIAGTMGQLASVFGEESQAGKALAIGQTLISTYSAAAAALREPPLGAGPIFGPIVAAGAVISGLANVAKIKSTKLPYGDGASASVGGGGSPSVPSVPTGIGGAGLVPNLEGITTAGIGETPPVQAFVVENDISNAQALQQELDVQATL